LISVLGIAATLAGGVLAYRASLKNRPVLQAMAGLLLIIGFACLGIVIGLPLR
jgi:hypothetical protein